MEASREQNTPLLRKVSQNGQLRRRNSVNSLRNEFISRLPDKLRSGIDHEAPYDVDFSKTLSLTPGFFLLLSD